MKEVSTTNILAETKEAAILIAEKSITDSNIQGFNDNRNCGYTVSCGSVNNDKMLSVEESLTVEEVE